MSARIPAVSDALPSGTALLYLRAHHGLCIRFFQGKGYSAEFVQHMREVIDLLERTDPEITLLADCDALCSHCPHRRGEICRSAEKVRSFDLSVLALCGLHPGEQLHWSALHALVDRQILTENRLREVCADCEWYALCANTPPLR